ncbi:MAG: hypothetical protein JSW00_13830 [Thermoplasmata archaeon]|nr:MAG: hypothetical protein JSW00_13830 [Thermoplasmata archaeon]
MTICPYCGIDFVQPQAAQQYPPQQQPPSKAPSKGPLIIGIVLAVVVVIIIAVFAVIMLDGDGNGKDNGNGDKNGKENGNGDESAITMTFAELIEDVESSENTLEFKTLEPGDTLKIEDEIVYIASEYDEWDEETVTYIWFKSAHKSEDIDDWYDDYWDDYYNYDFTFKGNLTNDFDVEDDVVVTLHVIKIDMYGYEREYFEEMWDEDAQTVQNLPSSCIKKA